MGGTESKADYPPHLHDPLGLIAAWVDAMSHHSHDAPHDQQCPDQQDKEGSEGVARVHIPDAVRALMDTTVPLRRSELYSLGCELCRMDHQERERLVRNLHPTQQDRCCAAAQEFCDVWKALSMQEIGHQARERGLTEEELLNIRLIQRPGMLKGFSAVARRNRPHVVTARQGVSVDRLCIRTSSQDDGASSVSSGGGSRKPSSSRNIARHVLDDAGTRKKRAQADNLKNRAATPDGYTVKSPSPKPPPAPSRIKNNRVVRRRRSLVPLTHMEVRLGR